MGFIDTAPRENRTVVVSIDGCWEEEASTGLLDVSAIFFASCGSFLLRSYLKDGFSCEHRCETGKIG